MQSPPVLPQHKDTCMLISLGADATFDYNFPHCAIEICKYTHDTLQYALDCVAESGTIKMCYDAIGSAGGRYVGLELLATHIQYTWRIVRADWVIGRTLSGLPVRLDGVVWSTSPTAGSTVCGIPFPNSREVGCRWSTETTSCRVT